MSYQKWLNKEGLKCRIDYNYFDNSGGIYVSKRHQDIENQKSLIRLDKIKGSGYLYNEWKLKTNVYFF